MKNSKSLIILVFGRILQAFIAILTIKCATHFMSAIEIGNYYVLSSVATLFGVTLISPFGQFVNRKLHSWHDQNNLQERFFIYNFYIFFISILSIPITFIAKHSFGFLTEISYQEVMLFSAMSIFLNTWFNTLVPTLNMLGKRGPFTLFSIANLSGSLLCSILLINQFGHKGSVWYFGQFIAFQSFMTFLVYLYFRKNIFQKVSPLSEISIPSKVQLRSVFMFSSPLIVATFFMWLLNDSYRFIVEKMLGLESLGNIAVGLSVATSIFALLESLFQQIFLPKFYKDISNATSEERVIACQKLVDIAFPLYFYSTLYLICSAPFILRLLTSQKFSESFIVVILGCGISFFRVITNVTSTIAHSEFNTKKLIFPYAVGGVSAVGLTMLMLRYFPNHYGVCLSLLISNLLVFMIMKWQMSKLAKFKIPFKALATLLGLGLPFTLEILFWNKTDMFTAFFVSLFFGLYYCFILFKRFSKILSQV